MRALECCVLLITLSTSVAAENWPHWRGPNGDGVSRETGLPTNWSATNGVAWRIPMPGRSGATPIIWGETVFLNVAEEGDLQLWALDRKDGSSKWKRFVSGGDHRKQKQNMSTPSPVTDGAHVWIVTGTGILKSFDFEGNERWSRDIQKDYGKFGLGYGYASSPLLFEGGLYVPVLHGMETDDSSYLLRIDGAMGKTTWRVERPTDAIRESPDAYITPALLEYEGKLEIVLTGGDVVTGHDLETGKELWRAHGLNPTNQPNYRIIASPVVMDGVIYAPPVCARCLR